MNSRFCSLTNRIAARRHRLRCPACRESYQADPRLADELARIDAGNVPEAGLARAMETVRVTRSTGSGRSAETPRAFLGRAALHPGVALATVVIAALLADGGRMGRHGGRVDGWAGGRVDGAMVKPGSPSIASLLASPAAGRISAGGAIAMRSHASGGTAARLVTRPVEPAAIVRVEVRPDSAARSGAPTGTRAGDSNSALSGTRAGDPSLARGVTVGSGVLKPRRGRSRGGEGPRPDDDLFYLNQPAAPARPKKRPAAPGLLEDDFITVPLPRIAAADTPATRSLITRSVEKYNEERAVVDPRLEQKVDVEMKAGDLGDLMAQLTQKTGVRFYVNADLADLKLTVLMNKTPVRDLMRQVVRLFNLEWRRLGDDPRYTYSLVQTLKQRLAEEEMKQQDQDQMVLNIDKELNRYLPNAEIAPERLAAMAKDAEERAKTAGSVEGQRRALADAQMYDVLADPRGNAAVRLYSQLTGDQLVSLRETGEVVVSPEDASRELPQSLWEGLETTQDQTFSSFGHVLETEADGKPRIEVHFALDRSQPDRARLSVQLQSHIRSDAEVAGMAPRAAMMDGRSLTVGEPDHLVDPGNTADHASLRSDPGYRAKLTLDPRPEAPPSLSRVSSDELERVWRLAHSTAGAEGPAIDAAATPRDPKEWVDSGDVLAEIHRKTGRSIVADYYLRVYPRSTFSRASAKLLDTLNDVADGLKSSWRPDGGFLRLRRFDYYTQRAQEIPNRTLARWKAESDRQGYLGLEGMSEIAGLPDRIQKDLRLEQAVLVKWGVKEWPLATRADTATILHLYGALDAGQRLKVGGDSGLSLADLTPAQLDIIRHGMLFVRDGIDAPGPSYHRLFLRTRGPGFYSWTSQKNPTPALCFPGKEEVYETDSDKAKAKVREIVKTHPEIRAGIEKSLPSMKQWRPWATYDTEIDGQIHGPGTQIWIGIQSGDRFDNFYNG